MKRIMQLRENVREYVRMSLLEIFGYNSSLSLNFKLFSQGCHNKKNYGESIRIYLFISQYLCFDEREHHHSMGK